MVSKEKVWEEGGGCVQEKQVPRRQSDVDITLNGLAGISPPTQLLSNAVGAHDLGESGPSLHEASANLKESRLVLLQIQGLRSASKEHVSVKQVRLQDRWECCNRVWCLETILMDRHLGEAGPKWEAVSGLSLQA